MALRQINVITSSAHKADLQKASEKHEAVDCWSVSAGNKKISFSILVNSQQMQKLVDLIQSKYLKEDFSRIVISTIDTSISKKDNRKEEEENKKKKGDRSPDRLSREELYTGIAKNADLSPYFLLLVFFSTIVAAIGMIENNVAVVVGAMVIAPFLGPNLALSFGALLGDKELVKKAFLTNISGTTFALIIAFSIGMFWPIEQISHELKSRTYVDYSTILLALASGAAAVLSLTKGTSTVLVGVMVAVALLPPITATGIFLGLEKYQDAYQALTLLMVNIVCINLSAKLVFWVQDVSPRTWQQRKKAKFGLKFYIIFWILCLAGLAYLIMLEKEVKELLN